MNTAYCFFHRPEYRTENGYTTPFNRKNLTHSQSIGLIVFGKKPKKANSNKPKDLRRISLLNTDYKLYSALPTRRLTKLSNKGLSPMQYGLGTDKRIQHAIALAIAAIDSGMRNNRNGTGILDNDYRAAFDLMCAI